MGFDQRAFDAGRNVFQSVGITAIGDNCEQARMRGAEFRNGELGDLMHVVRGARAAVIRAPSAQHQQNRSAEVRGHPGVEGEFGGAADIGVVAAKDDDGVAPALHCGEAGDDLAEGGLRIGVHELVADPDAVVIVEVDTVVGEQQLQHVVAFDGGTRDRAKNSDPIDLTAEGFENPERYRRLTGVAFG